MTILTESIPKPASIRRRIEHLRKALADLEFLLPVAERVHGATSSDKTDGRNLAATMTELAPDGTRAES